MPRYDANVSFMFADLPFLDRFAAAKDAGFEAVEFMWPSPEQLAGLTLEAFAAQVRGVGVGVALFNLLAGDPAAGMTGLAGVPDQRDVFRAHVPVALSLAKGLGCSKVHALAGNVVEGVPREAQIECLVENVAWAADLARPEGITVTLEALNPVDFPRYLLQGSAVALAMVRRIGRPNVRFQFDAYHLSMIGEDPVVTAEVAGPLIGHAQFADAPGRHEPGSASVRFDDVVAALERVGYDGWIGLEYKPIDVASRDFSFVERLLGGRLHTRV
jgi:hydroxypyruvate isomerase